MDNLNFLPLIYNAALLLILVYIYSIIPEFKISGRLSFINIAVGIVLGGIGILIMQTPWQFASGIVFDARSVLLTISGLFFGTFPVLIAMTMTAIMRLFDGGVGVFAGIAVIISSGIIGLLWRNFRVTSLEKITWRELFLLGLTVHVTMLVLMFLLPWDIAIEVLKKITLPVLMIFPAAVTLLGILLVNNLRQQQSSRALAESEFLFHSQFDLGNIGIAITSVDKKWLRINHRLCEMLDYSEDELREMDWVELTHPDDLQSDMVYYEKLLSGEIDFYELDKRFYRKNGSTIHTHLTVACYRTENHIKFVIATLLDISVAKKTKEDLASKTYILGEAQKLGHIGSWEFDIINNKLIWSDESYNVFGLPKDTELTYETFLSCIHPEDRDYVDTHKNRSFEKKTYDIEYRLLVNGRVKWVREKAEFKHDDNGLCIRSIGFTQDITQQKNTEKALRESERRMRAIFDNAPIGIALIDSLTGHFIEANARYAEIVGISLDNLTSTDWMKITHPDDVQKDFENMALLISGKIKGFQMDKRYINPNDSVIWVSLSVAGLSSGSSGCSQHLAIIDNITERKKAKKELLSVTEKITNTYNISPGIICTLDYNTQRFEECNPAVTQILGLSVEEFTTTPVLELIHPDDRQRTSQEIERQLQGKEVVNFQNRYRCKDGSFKWLAWQATRPDENGKVNAVATDITLIKQNEEEREMLITELERKNTEIENFTYTVSHDLKAPLVSIQGFSGLLKKDVLAGDVQQINEDLEQIKFAALAMETLLTELLDFSRVGRLDNPHENIQMNELIDEVIDILSGAIPKNINIKVEPQLPMVCADRPRVKTLLQNLIENAVKFMGNQSEPCIEISSYSKNQIMVYTIKDNGIGIKHSYHDKVFGMFEHLNPEITGTGMGLALAKRIVEMHGGRIWLESDGEGCGTTFFFTLSKQGDA